MRSIVVCAVVLVAIANGIHGQPTPHGEKQICVPGTQSKVDCNTCVCSRDGTALGCTRMECPKIPAEYLNPDGSIKSPSQIHGNPLLRTKRERVCEPGTERQWRCNTCRCSPDGTAEICTRKVCPEPRERREIRCTPNESYKVDCNTCFCGADGRPAACTLIGCIGPAIPNYDGSIKFSHDNEPRLKREAPFSCKPLSHFKQDCNDCVCSADGRSAGCTYKFCV